MSSLRGMAALPAMPFQILLFHQVPGAFADVNYYVLSMHADASGTESQSWNPRRYGCQKTRVLNMHDLQPDLRACRTEAADPPG